ncbi:MAG TPA: DUF1588 domain-containing protein, partial [Planctomycetes bacterium]|nr:DUF1588 domain-containing protein [Planctomycetota bacterium]
VKRGKWLLENLLGQAPPPPPPGNDSFADEDAIDDSATLRKQMAQHRGRSKCAVCHVRMDALGLAMERFDAIGRYRERDSAGVIDASGELPDGRKIDGLVERTMEMRVKRALEQGLKDRSSFLIAKAVTALRESGATAQEIIQHGLFYGAHKTNDGWSSGVAILTLCANLWDDVDAKDHNLFLVHGLTQIANRTSGSSRRQRFPFPRAAVDPDLTTMKRWFRRYVDLRDRGAAERILLTLHDRGEPVSVLADFVFSAATDFYFTGDGHALDFANKMFEALKYVEGQGAHEILRPVVVDLVSRTRHEETSRWQDSVPALEEIIARIDDIWEANQQADAEQLD